MADQITARYEAGKYPVHPEGLTRAVCVDVIDLGEKVEQFKAQPAYLAHKCAIVFQSEVVNEATGKPFEPTLELSVSMGKKAALRKHLETWRGKPYTDEQLEAGAPLHKLVGQNALLTIAHKTSGAGRVYANITAVTARHPSMPELTAQGYERAMFWEDRKREYALGAEAFRAEQAKKEAAHAHPVDSDELHPALAQGEDDSDLPF
jgi:hypothetical protein